MATLAVVAACNSSRAAPLARLTTAAAPVVICGKTLYSGAHGLPVYTPPLKSGTRVNPLGPELPLLVRVAPGCSHGTILTIIPPGIAAIATEIDAADHLPVAVSLTGLHAGAGELVIRRDNDVIGRVPLNVVFPPVGGGWVTVP